MASQISPPLLLNLNFGGLNPTDALSLSGNVISALTNHDFFKNIPLDPLIATEARLKESTRATYAGDRTQIPQRDADLAMHVKELTRLGLNLQLLALDEQHHLYNSGYEFQKRRPRSKAPHPPLTALMGFEVINSEDPGVAVVNATGQPGAFGYQFQFTYGDPSIEQDWKDARTTKGCSNIKITGLESLKRCTFRGRALSDDGTPGPWSAHVTIPVT